MEEVEDVKMKLCDLHRFSADQLRGICIDEGESSHFLHAKTSLSLFVKGEKEEGILLVGDVDFVGPSGEKRKNNGHRSGSDLNLWKVAQPWEGLQGHSLSGFHVSPHLSVSVF